MKRKRRQELFAFYDDTSMKKHLEKMAKEGWMIEKMSNYFWTYVKIDPKDITFEITYHHASSEFDPHRSDEQMTFDEFCEHTGWNLALSWHQMQIYYNERSNPTPIQTDPALRLEMMHKAMWSNYLISYIILFVISLPLSVLFLISLIKAPEKMINTNGGTVLFTGTMLIILALYTAFDLGIYFRWRKKALTDADNEIFTDSPNTTLIQKSVIYFTYSVFAMWIIKTLFNASPFMIFSTASYFVSLFVAAVTMDKAKDLFKFLNVSRDVNKVLSFIVTFIAAFISTRILTYIILLITGNGELIEYLF